MPQHATRLAILATLIASPSALGAAADNFIETEAVSFDPHADLRPICPINGQAFQVRFQARTGDLTSAQVAYTGAITGVAPASVLYTKGPYDVWGADIPASTTTAQIEYQLQLFDGTDEAYVTTFGVTGVSPGGLDFEVDFDTLSHAPLGATVNGISAIFKVWAPDITTVAVLGDFNNWSPSVAFDKQGDFHVLKLPVAFTGNGYKYIFDGSTVKPDARGRALDPGDGYHSVVVDALEHSGSDEGFSPRPLEEWVIYELHVGSFSGRNDPEGSAGWPSEYGDVEDRVAHLVELGVNAVQLNPANEFPGELSGGYNPISSWAMESSYGRTRDFKRMVDALHDAGIAVILDVVWNHFDSFENFLWNYTGNQIYFDTPEVTTPWGPQADYNEHNVRDYFSDAAQMLMDECRLDGFRIDAVYETIYGPQGSAGQALMQTITEMKERRHEDSVIIGEIYDDNAWNTIPRSSGGLGCDAQYHNNFKQAIRSAVFAAASGSANVGWLASAIGGTGDVSGDRAFNYFELHDEAWGLSGSERAVRTIDPTTPNDDQYAAGRTKLANGLVLLARGVPGILQGTEWLEDDEWEQQKIDWAHKTMYSEIFDFYKTLIGLRTSTPALFANSGHQSIHVNESADVLAFQRWDNEGGIFVVAANFSNTEYAAYRLGFPADGQWTEVINSQSTAYGGSGGDNPTPIQTEPISHGGWPRSAEIRLAPMALAVFQYNAPVPACAGDVDGDGDTDVFDFGDLASNFGAGPGATQAMGDLTGDGFVDVFDFAELASDFGCSP